MGVIPAEAVEAAAKQMAVNDGDLIGWALYQADAQRVLEAAAPYMMAAAWEEAIEAYKAWTWDDENMDPLTNPYRPTPPMIPAEAVEGETQSRMR